ncbi:putative nucleotidyltransferase substrate binding domain-containing protein [Tsukamurella sp. 8F]|uniref:putative nucleotidyltransferase substrate binding domain-containing protein n=1 Tax=unclassified Tsukamurella TaxID=2633480 RepID=UPI0023B968E2|nr:MULTISPECIES: putative nucleotidyltransferase substrate binding domain-containing protein [unclassified Tsukamurella]MDF0531429.1 putative nucleotidyltransferase substrate binding domain-containing protein [Tsukamurella sp. 8J]MDF0587508.1 putative nucleotidyltransferase substrate binding domain-containing protein [Tsukamurella sp. 8F]
MTDFTAPEELAAFLERYAPFDGLEPGELAHVVGESSLLEFAEGAVVLDGVSASPEHAWVVLDGRVGLWNFPAVPPPQGAELPGLDDVVGPGGVFGYVVILAGAKGGPRAVALSDVTLLRLPAWAVGPMFSTPAGAAFLATELAREPVVQGISGERRERTAAEIVRRAPVVCAPGVTIRDAAVAMTAARSGYVVVEDDAGPVGIVTDHDLRARVVSVGRDVDGPVSGVMTTPLTSVTGERFSSDVLLEMLDRKLHYMPVLDGVGALLGVVQDVDFLTAPTTSTFALQRQIEHAPASELPELGHRIREIFPVLAGQQEHPRHISGVASVAIEAMVRRCIELELTVHPELGEGDLTWLSLGSVSRREVLPSSDVDSAIIITDPPAGTSPDEIERRRSACLALAAAVHTRLEECGIPSDTNGAVAAVPRFCRTESEWLAAAHDWIADPLSNQAMMMASLLIDGRPVWGDLTLQPVAGVYRHLSEHPRAFKLMLRESLTTKARIRSLRDVVSLRAGTFDIKAHALVPVVNIARWAALASGSTQLQTRNRLAAGAGSPVLPDDSAQILVEVFSVLMRLRLEHQVTQMNSGREPNDLVAVRQMSPLSRSLLEQAVREVASVQRRMSNLATYLGDSEW